MPLSTLQLQVADGVAVIDLVLVLLSDRSTAVTESVTFVTVSPGPDGQGISRNPIARSFPSNDPVLS